MFRQRLIDIADHFTCLRILYVLPVTVATAVDHLHASHPLPPFAPEAVPGLLFEERLSLAGRARLYRKVGVHLKLSLYIDLRETAERTTVGTWLSELGGRLGGLADLHAAFRTEPIRDLRVAHHNILPAGPNAIVAASRASP
jgi:hypothetical protein